MCSSPEQSIQATAPTQKLIAEAIPRTTKSSTLKPKENPSIPQRVIKNEVTPRKIIGITQLAILSPSLLFFSISFWNKIILKF
jgi:hypothetical protein